MVLLAQNILEPDFIRLCPKPDTLIQKWSVRKSGFKHRWTSESTNAVEPSGEHRYSIGGIGYRLRKRVETRFHINWNQRIQSIGDVCDRQMAS